MIALLLHGVASFAAPLNAQWAATDGFKDAKFCSFDSARYQGMVNDQSRTPVFAEAIRRALLGREGELVVLDIGAGPVALLALLAAKAGAKKVYAIEVNPEVAELARQAIADSVARGEVADGVVTLLQGFSTEIDLPEKCDLIIAEIVGSVASSEGIYATMYDVQQRHLKAPHDPASYIPLRVETLCAPMSYALHHPGLGPKDFDWEAVRRDGPPPCFACSSREVQVMAEPQIVESICLDSPLPPPGERLERSLTFTVCEERLRENADDCAAALTGAGAPLEPAQQVAAEVAASLTGVGFWPRLVLDVDETLVIDSRGVDGRPQRSHWQTVLPLLSATPTRVSAGDVLRVQATTQLGAAINEPVRYEVSAEVVDREE